MKNATSHVDLHTRNLRKGRFSEQGRTYLITSVVHSRRPIFSDWRIGRLLVEELRTTEKSGLVQSLAWVVMPDHLHWLLTLQSGDLPALMRRIKGRSAISINRALCSQGQVWQKGSTITHCARMKICKQWRVTLSQTRYVRAWSKGSATIRYGTQSGFRQGKPFASKLAPTVPPPCRSQLAGDCMYNCCLFKQ